jgi:toxin CcdB
MAQFDLYWNSDQQSKHAYPLLLDVQTNLLEQLTSRMVIPLTLVTSSAGPFPTHLCPTLIIEDKEYALLTHQMAAISVRSLTDRHSSIANRRSEIINAIDFLITGI